jgi:NADP-dependent 3-hydroxy acid dehydrogenase YdfG
MFIEKRLSMEKEKVVPVTGASSGLGKAVATLLSERFGLERNNERRIIP